MKRRIMVLASGSMLLLGASITNLVDMKHAYMHVVKAEEINNETIEELVKDETLRQIFMDELKDKYNDEDVDNFSATMLGELSFNDIVNLTGVYDLDGIQYINDIRKVQFGNPVDNILLLNEFAPLYSFQIDNMELLNFDDFYDLKNPSNSIKINEQKLILEKEIVEGNEIIIDFSEKIGSRSFLRFDKFEIYLNSSEKLDDIDTNYEHLPSKKGLVIKNLKETASIVGDSYEGEITIYFREYIKIAGRETFAYIKVIQPYSIPIKETESGSTGSYGGNGTNYNIQPIDETNIMTDEKSLDVYNVNGNLIGEKKLTEEITDFKTDKLNTVGRNEFYKIGENEWVKKDAVKVFHFNDSYVQTHGSKYKNLTKFRNTGTVEDRGLEKSTDWYTDRYAFFQGEWHHRVATHEWIHDDHVVEYQNINGVVHANETATLYNSKGKKITDRALAKDSAFLTDKKATIDGKLMYRVATDEWVDADTVTFK